MVKLKYSNIFDAIAADPAEAATLKFRADLMVLLREYFRSRAATPAQIAQLLGVPQPRVSELMNGKLDKFSADKLIGFAAHAGIRFYPELIKTTTDQPVVINCKVILERG